MAKDHENPSSGGGGAVEPTASTTRSRRRQLSSERGESGERGEREVRPQRRSRRSTTPSAASADGDGEGAGVGGEGEQGTAGVAGVAGVAGGRRGHRSRYPMGVDDANGDTAGAGLAGSATLRSKAIETPRSRSKSKVSFQDSEGGHGGQSDKKKNKINHFFSPKQKATDASPGADTLETPTGDADGEPAEQTEPIDPRNPKDPTEQPMQEPMEQLPQQQQEQQPQRELVLLGPKPRGLYECDYCRTDLTRAPRIRCAICPDFDLCLDCLATSDHAEVTRVKRNEEWGRRKLRTLAVNESAGGDDDGGGSGGGRSGRAGGKGSKTAGEDTEDPNALGYYIGDEWVPYFRHRADHGYIVADSTRYVLFPSFRGVMVVGGDGGDGGSDPQKIGKGSAKSNDDKGSSEVGTQVVKDEENADSTKPKGATEPLSEKESTPQVEEKSAEDANHATNENDDMDVDGAGDAKNKSKSAPESTETEKIKKEEEEEKEPLQGGQSELDKAKSSSQEMETKAEEDAMQVEPSGGSTPKPEESPIPPTESTPPEAATPTPPAQPPTTPPSAPPKPIQYILTDNPKDAWTIEEDLRLIDAIQACGLGNWPDIAEHVSGGFMGGVVGGGGAGASSDGASDGVTKGGGAKSEGNAGEGGGKASGKGSDGNGAGNNSEDGGSTAGGTGGAGDASSGSAGVAGIASSGANGGSGTMKSATIGNKSAKQCMERYLDDFLGRYGHILPPYTMVPEIEEEDSTSPTAPSPATPTASATPSTSKRRRKHASEQTLFKAKPYKKPKFHVQPTDSLYGTPSHPNDPNDPNSQASPTTQPNIPNPWPHPYIPPKINVKKGQPVNRDLWYKSEQSFVRQTNTPSLSKASFDQLRADFIQKRNQNLPGYEAKVLPPRLEDVLHSPGAELAGYMPRRGDFDMEYENDAEKIIAEMEFSADDSKADKELKLEVIRIFNEKLNERERRKEFIKKEGLLNYRENQEKLLKMPPDERHLVQRMRLFARYHSKEEHDSFVSKILEAKRLRKEIAKLQMYRRMGIRTMVEAEKYELDKMRREYHRWEWMKKEEERKRMEGERMKMMKGNAGGEEVLAGMVGVGGIGGMGVGGIGGVGGVGGMGAVAGVGGVGAGGVGAVGAAGAVVPAGKSTTSGGLAINAAGNQSLSIWKQFQSKTGEGTRSSGQSGEAARPMDASPENLQGAEKGTGVIADANATLRETNQPHANQVGGGTSNDPNTPLALNSTEPPNTTSITPTSKPFTLKDKPGYNLLTPKELSLCQRLRLLPQQYLDVKKVLIAESLNAGLWKSSKSTVTTSNTISSMPSTPSGRGKKNTVLQLDVVQKEGVIEFVMRSGWIPSRPQIMGGSS